MLEPEIGLVGRDSTAALVESLIDRRARYPLPVLVAFGPGGSGKTTLLDHVRRRCEPSVPLARVDLDETGSKSCRDVLDAAHNQLRQYYHPQFGRLRMPRYGLARAVLGGRPPAEADPLRAARELIGRDARTLPTVTDALSTVAEASTPTQWLGRLMRPLGRSLATVATVLPGWLRWLAGYRQAAVLRWYEREAGRELLRMSPGCKVDAVISQLWHLADSEDRRDRLTVDRFLVAAFLADIEAAYRGARHRKVNCVLLLDGADLLSPIELNLFPADRPVSPAPPTDVVELLAEARLRHPDLPLLVIATKQSTADIEDIPLPPELAGEDGGDPSSVDIARAVYWGWRNRFERVRRTDSAYLPIRLRSFTRDETGQFLAQWTQRRAGTVERPALVSELHEVTHGHPLAVRLAIKVVDRRYARDRVVPPVRSVYAQLVPNPEAEGADRTETVGEYLMLRFLQRFRDSDLSQRTLTRQLLARLAAPRRLDVHTIRLLVPDRDADEIWTSLSTYSFVTLSPDCAQLEFHPLLRDLLAEELLRTNGNPDFTHDQVHRALRDHYARLGKHSDRLYHCLALGDVRAVALYLAPRIAQWHGRWATELEEIAAAPYRSDIEVAPLKAGLGWLKGPRLRRVEDLVRATWRLRSGTGTALRGGELFHDVLDGYRSLNADDDPSVARQLSRYRALVHASQDGNPATPLPQLPEYCTGTGKHPYPRVWPPRHAIRKSVAVLSVVLLVLYGAVYIRHVLVHCDREGPLSVGTVAGTLFDDSKVLSNMDGECVGVTGAAGTFLADESTAGEDDHEVAELTRLIKEQNDQVLKEAGRAGGRPYVSIVVATMLSSTERPKRDLSAGVNELRGAYLAQRDWNRFRTSTIQRGFLVRLLPANFGGDSEHAEHTAEQIRGLADADPTVVAVSGMGQTRDATVRAAELLGTATGTWTGIPMMGSAPSGNTFSGKPYFFRVAPTNARQAQVAIEWAVTARPFRGRQPFLVYNPTDRYSRELKEDYQRELEKEQRKQVPELRAGIEKPYEAGTTGTASTLRTRVREICEENPPDLPGPMIVYSGRANELPTLLDELSRSTCRDEAIILGGDDLSQLETAGFRDLAGREDYASERLFFTTFGPTREGWELRGNGRLEPGVDRFFADHLAVEREQRQRGGPAFRSGPNGHVMLSYDAVHLLLTAAERARTDARGVPNRHQVYQSLRETTGALAHSGVTGKVDFGAPDRALGRGGANPQDKLVVVQEVVKQDGRLVSSYLTSRGR
ncbi:hypothetical protein NLX83_24435 [Allokutzneria sp. A3M-2-11 16]|uniref:hypothetical protein n=1 Tax=Allokutzneria sp. A3M-2-11 16 TaxID=2962043 RepID=UPI0020B8B3C7|nr:hypothetical protein [Allokutzneria sp. A3M-2-11 16]MCP3802421.1 hypothetical protein [Allokutzneria sp. A3M-2-11 16]